MSPCRKHRHTLRRVHGILTRPNNPPAAICSSFYIRASLVALRYYYRTFLGLDMGNNTQAFNALCRQNPVTVAAFSSVPHTHAHSVSACWTLLGCTSRRSSIGQLLYVPRWTPSHTMAALCAAAYTRSVLEPLKLLDKDAALPAIYYALLLSTATTLPDEATARCCVAGAQLFAICLALSTDDISNVALGHPLLRAAAIADVRDTSLLISALGTPSPVPDIATLFQNSYALTSNLGPDVDSSIRTNVQQPMELILPLQNVGSIET
ncbi:ORF43 [Ranid herpesvirus 1]|uniref:ORF43 n=1 Tax=Ranid herpesvirus 1 TaxID=85655 RepID=Q14VR5_9VIRU|nr:ORF43 [Ranid herpesvirus 1]ABG25779.1 ORF43 [Ranid herpesvirus 1]